MNEYDGLESISVNYQKYLLNNIRNILKTEELNGDEKVRKLNELLEKIKT